MSVTWQSNVPRRLDELVKDVVGDGVELVKEETRLAAKSIARWTPPKKYSDGRKQVAGDIGKTYGTFYLPGKREDIRSGWLKRVLDAGDVGGMNQFLRRNAIRAQVGPFQEQHHEDQRRRGRVSRAAARKRLVTNRGDAAALRRFRTAKQKKVGTYKAAWMFYHVKFGGKSPAWISRRFDASKVLRNRYRENLRRGTDEPFVEITNASHPHTIENLPRVMKARQRALTTKLRARLRQRAQQFSR